MRVLVTGASGMIGRWTCDLLHEKGHDILGIDVRPKPEDSSNWPFEFCDILDSAAVMALVKGYSPTHLLHLAARTDLDGRTLADYVVNIEGTSNILSAVTHSESVIRAVYTSSQLVCKVGYAPRRDDDYLPNTMYGESKIETERLVRAASGGGVSWCIARPTTVWGPHMNEHYRSLLRHIEKGRYFHSGSGPLFKSYSYAGNIAWQYVQLLEAEHTSVQGKVFYMADYEPLSLRKYVNALARELGARQPVTVPLPIARLFALIGDGLASLGLPSPYNSFRLKNIRTEYTFDLSATESICGPLPFTFEDGVKDTAAWYRSLN